MARTIHEIIKSVESGAECTDVENAIAAAFWAGQAQMRGQITEQIATRIKSLPVSRYHRVARQAAEHVCKGGDGLSTNYLNGRGDSGTQEAAEILAWRYLIQRSTHKD